MDLASADMHDDGYSLATIVEDGRDGELGFEHIRVTFFLPTVMGDPLTKVTVPIQEPNRDER